MAWLIVVAAGILEAGFAVCLKLSHGFTRLGPTVLFAAFALSSFGLLTLALRHLEVGPAYAAWMLSVNAIAMTKMVTAAADTAPVCSPTGTRPVKATGMAPRCRCGAGEMETRLATGARGPSLSEQAAR